jgi:hypothetical protein
MTQTQTLRKLARTHWRSVERIARRAYQEGLDAGLTRAHGQRRRGRTVREDSTVAGLLRNIERNFGLGRYRFELQVVHPGTRRRVPGSSLLRSYREDEA